MPAFFGQVIELPPQTVGPGPAILTASLHLLPPRLLAGEAPTELRVRIRGAIRAAGARAEQQHPRPAFPMQVSLELQPGEGTIEVEYDVYYCRQGDASVCLYREARLLLPVQEIGRAHV